MWFSDQHDKRVVAMSPDGTAETIYLLRSIRAMMIFFTVLTVIGLILGIITVVHVAQAANNSGL